jgi:hypothetical protein
MKTFREIFSDIVQTDFINENVTIISPEERAAKEYAKQWVDRCERYSFMPKIIAEKIKQEIDEQ